MITSSFARTLRLLLTWGICLSSSYCIGEDYDPIALYLTWQRSPDTTMTIQWISYVDREEDLIEYAQEGEAYWQLAIGSHLRMPAQDPYYIHTVELVDLAPATVYYFRTGSDSVIYKFRTMPEKLDEIIRFVVGGDMYHDDIEYCRETNRQAAKTNPMFALVGGDIAYAADKKFSYLPGFTHSWLDALFKQKADRWLTWLIAWKNDMVTTDGMLIPILPALGNHDVSGRFGQTPEQAPFFYSLFPMPGAQGYNRLDFGDYLSLFILDSGHTHPISGHQQQWLARALEEKQHVPNKFALYHVPAYPSIRKIQNEYCASIRKHWVPLFETFGLTAAFEHHDHAYKRTHPILNGQVNSSGVLYLGDGAWGVAKPRHVKQHEQRWYLARTASIRHFILAVIEGEKRHFIAISSTGEFIDEVVQ